MKKRENDESQSSLDSTVELTQKYGISIETSSRRFESYAELEAWLIPKLRNCVFHVTTLDGYAGILGDHAIKSNVDGRYPMTFAQSEASYFRKNGCVSLIDLRNASDCVLEEAKRKYYFPSPSSVNHSVFLVLKPSCYSNLISWEVSKKDEGLRAMIVPYIEAGYPDSIPLDCIEKVFITELQINSNISLPDLEDEHFRKHV